MSKIPEIISGTWANNTRWQLVESTTPPPAELVTAVACIAFVENDEIILARSKRGWGVLGGHVEPGETPTEAVVRESLEEGGFAPHNPQQFAVREITATEPTLRPESTTDYYPFPHTYQTYYWATTEQPLVEITGEEILESGHFSLDAIEQMNIADFAIIQLGYLAYQASRSR